jgi:hypothetical protein
MSFKMKCLNYETGFTCNVSISDLSEKSFKRGYRLALAKENPICECYQVRSQTSPEFPKILDGKHFILQSYGADIYSDDAKLLFTFR